MEGILKTYNTPTQTIWVVLIKKADLAGVDYLEKYSGTGLPIIVPNDFLDFRLHPKDEGSIRFGYFNYKDGDTIPVCIAADNCGCTDGVCSLNIGGCWDLRKNHYRAKINIPTKLTRLEVIGKNGRILALSGLEDVELSYQDDGRTLKIHIFYENDR